MQPASFFMLFPFKRGSGCAGCTNLRRMLSLGTSLDSLQIQMEAVSARFAWLIAFLGILHTASSTLARIGVDSSLHFPLGLIRWIGDYEPTVILFLRRPLRRPSTWCFSSFRALARQLCLTGSSWKRQRGRLPPSR